MTQSDAVRQFVARAPRPLSQSVAALVIRNRLRNPEARNALTELTPGNSSGRSLFREGTMAKISKFVGRNKAAPRLDTPTDLSEEAVTEVSDALNGLLADSFALYLKTKNFHWHVSGPHFRDYHLMLDEQAAAIFATTDELAERVRKIGGTTLRSIGQISKLQSITDNEED